MTHGNPAFRARGISFLSLLNAAVQSATAGGEKLPTIEAAIVLEDIVEFPTQDGTHSLWTWTSNMTDTTHDRHWLIPNFDFYGAGIPPSPSHISSTQTNSHLPIQAISAPTPKPAAAPSPKSPPGPTKFRNSSGAAQSGTTTTFAAASSTPPKTNPGPTSNPSTGQPKTPTSPSTRCAPTP
jgi:hypothetical protein